MINVKTFTYDKLATLFKTCALSLYAVKGTLGKNTFSIIKIKVSTKTVFRRIRSNNVNLLITFHLCLIS